MKEAIRNYLVRKAMFRMRDKYPEKFEKIIGLMQPRIKKFSDIEIEGDFFFYPLKPTKEDIEEVRRYFYICGNRFCEKIDRAIEAIKDARSEFDELTAKIDWLKIGKLQ